VGGELARHIVDFEQSDQMTLMHRFNKAADLLDQVQQVSVQAAFKRNNDNQHCDPLLIAVTLMQHSSKEA